MFILSLLVSFVVKQLSGVSDARRDVVCEQSCLFFMLNHWAIMFDHRAAHDLGYLVTEIWGESKTALVQGLGVKKDKAPKLFWRIAVITSNLLIAITFNCSLQFALYT